LAGTVLYAFLAGAGDDVTKPVSMRATLLLKGTSFFGALCYGCTITREPNSKERASPSKVARRVFPRKSDAQRTGSAKSDLSLGIRPPAVPNPGKKPRVGEMSFEAPPVNKQIAQILGAVRPVE
jgi:hypothetical protein